MMGVAMVAKDEDFAVMFMVQYVAYLMFSELCNLTVGQVIWPLQGSGEQCALTSAPQEELKAFKKAEFDESVLLDGHLSVALVKALTRYTAGKTAATPLCSRSQARYAGDSVQCPEAAGVYVITTHPYFVRHGGPSSDALCRTRSWKFKNEADGAARKALGGTKSTLGCSRKPRSCQTPRESVDNW